LGGVRVGGVSTDDDEKEEGDREEKGPPHFFAFARLQARPLRGRRGGRAPRRRAPAF
jgi:hypothetical protein